MLFATFSVKFRGLLAGLGLLLAVGSAQAQAPVPPAGPVVPARRYPAGSLELAAGYGAPYGWGFGVSFMALPNLDVNAGLGFSLTGGKVGVGARYYFSPERKVSPFVGGNLVYSTGLNNVNINTSGQTTSTYGGYSNSSDYVVVNFKSTALLHLRGGIRWQPVRRFGLLGAVGYGVVLGPDAVEYVGGNASQSNRDLVRIFSPGGVELSVGVAFGIGPSY